MSWILIKTWSWAQTCVLFPSHKVLYIYLVSATLQYSLFQLLSYPFSLFNILLHYTCTMRYHWMILLIVMCLKYSLIISWLKLRCTVMWESAKLNVIFVYSNFRHWNLNFFRNGFFELFFNGNLRWFVELLILNCSLCNFKHFCDKFCWISCDF